MEKRFGELMAADSVYIFEIKVEIGSVAGRLSEIKESRDDDVDVNVSNILSQHEYILHRN